MKTLRKITRAVGMFIRQTDRLLIILCTLAASYGFLLVYSATTSAGGGFSDCLMQLVCIALGIVAALVISRLDYEFIASLWPFLEMCIRDSGRGYRRAKDEAMRTARR